MKKPISIVLATLLFIMSFTVCWADEKKDHVCFRSLDVNKDGKVTMQEFEKAYGDDEEKFNRADANGDGSLTHDEYHQMLGHGASE